MHNALAIANYRKVYDEQDIEHALAETEPSPHNGLLIKTYGKMKDKGGTRLVVKPSNADALDEVSENCPNFANIVQDLKKYIVLALDGSKPLHFMPILLLGDPGVGKTHFAKKLADALGTSAAFCSMATTSASWILTGSASTWSGAHHGKIAQTLIEDDVANPLMVLDELDKAQGGQYDPIGALYQLFERETAAHFTDEFLDVPFDASAILWVATANSAQNIPDPILSRMAVYEVPTPTPEQARHIALRMYRGLIAENGWNFGPDLGEAVLELLETTLPRRMRRVLMDAMGTAKLAGRNELSPADFARDNSPKRSIGFN